MLCRWFSAQIAAFLSALIGSKEPATAIETGERRGAGIGSKGRLTLVSIDNFAQQESHAAYHHPILFEPLLILFLRLGDLDFNVLREVGIHSKDAK